MHIVPMIALRHSRKHDETATALLRRGGIGTYGRMAKRKAAASADRKPRPAVRGDRIRALRETRGWSQHELAHRCALHPADISAIECGHRDMRTNNFLRLVVVLNTDANYLLGLSDKPPGAR